MSLSTRLLLRVLLPATALVLALAALHASDAEARAEERGLATLGRIARRGAEQVVARLDVLEGALDRLLATAADGRAPTPDAAARADAAAATLPARTRAFVDGHPEIRSLELRVAGRPGTLAAAGRDGPTRADGPPLRLRATRALPGGDVLVAEAELVPTALLVALERDLGWIAPLGCLHLADDESDCDGRPLAAAAAVDGRDLVVTVHQPRAVLAADTGLRTQAVAALAVVLAAMLALVWHGLRGVVLEPLRGVLAAVDGWRRGRPLPARAAPDARDEIARLEQALFGALREQSRAADEIGEVAATLEARVGERTEQLRRSSEELSEARDAALAAARARADFMANVSHEIRTPLNAVLGLSGLLLETSLDDEQREFARSVRRAGEELLDLVNDVLDFSSLEHGELQLEIVDLCPADLLAECADLVSEAARVKGLRVATCVHPDLPQWVSGDPGRLRQVVAQLLDNAVKFTDEGEITLRALPAPHGDDGEDATDLVRFEVVDTGIGVAVDCQPALFDPFVQADSSSTRRFGGAGLGLALCKHMARALGGRIGVESVEGRGSTFWFTARLPACRQRVAMPREDDERFLGVRALVVDDDATNRVIVRRELERLGMLVVEAASGREALVRASDGGLAGEPIDLLVLDMRMPDLDGVETARAFRQDPLLAGIPAVLLTSQTPREDATTLEQAGIVMRLRKPVHRLTLESALVRVVEQIGRRHVPVPEDVSTLASRRVLVVEDNPVNQKVALRLLEKLGLSADVAANGAEALEAHQRIPYGAILMDCQMPVMDGYEATRRIRASGARGLQVPIIAMTAHAMPGDRARVIASGMDDYLTKPVMREHLEAALDRWLPASQPTHPGDPTMSDPSAGGHAPIDPSALDELREYGPEVLGELIDIFLDDTPNRLDELWKAVECGDAHGTEQNAHALKSSCAQLGALELSDLCRKLEMMGRSGDLLGADLLAQQARTEFAAVKAALEAEKANAG